MMVGRYLAVLLLLSIVAACSAADEGWTFHVNEAPAERLRWTTETEMLAPIRAAFASGKPEDFLAVFAVETEQERMDLLRLWLHLRHPSTGSGIRHYAVNADQTDYIFAGYMVLDERVWDRRSAWDGPGFNRVSPIIVRVERAPGEKARYHIRWDHLFAPERSMALPASPAVGQLVSRTAASTYAIRIDRMAYLKLLQSTTGIDGGIAKAEAADQMWHEIGTGSAEERQRENAIRETAVHNGLKTPDTLYALTPQGLDGRLTGIRPYISNANNPAWQQQMQALFKPQVITTAAWTPAGQAGDPYEWEWANVLHRDIGRAGATWRLPSAIGKVSVTAITVGGGEGAVWRPLAYASIQIDGETYVCYCIRAVHKRHIDSGHYVMDLTGWLVRDVDGVWHKTILAGTFGNYFMKTLMPDEWGTVAELREAYERRWSLDATLPRAWRQQLLPVLMEMPPGVGPGDPVARPKPADELAFFHLEGRSPALDPVPAAPAGWSYVGMEPGIRKHALASPIHLGPDQTRPLHPMRSLLADVERRDFGSAAKRFVMTNARDRTATQIFLRWLYDPACSANILAYAYREDASRVYLAGHFAHDDDSASRSAFFILQVERSPGQPERLRLVLPTIGPLLAPGFSAQAEPTLLRDEPLDDPMVVRDLAARLQAEKTAIDTDIFYFLSWITFLRGSDYDLQPYRLYDARAKMVDRRSASIVEQHGENLREGDTYIDHIGTDAFHRDSIWLAPDSRARCVRLLPLTVLDQPVDFRRGENVSRHPDRVVNGFHEVFSAIVSEDRERLHAVSDIRDLTTADDPATESFHLDLQLASRQVLLGYITMTLDGESYYGCITRAFDEDICRDDVFFIQQRNDGSWLAPTMPSFANAAMPWLLCSQAELSGDQAALVALYREFWSIAPTVPTEWREKLLPVLGKAY